MSRFENADYYTDTSLVDDPHAYFKFLRDRCPVTPLPHRNVMAVTGFDEVVQVSLDTAHFSNINAVLGPLAPLPFEPEGDDILAQLDPVRDRMPFSDQLISLDGEEHAYLRSIVARLFTPRRLKALEQSLRETADSVIDEFVADGQVELVHQYGRPFATLIIADLLGIPAEDRARFRDYMANVVFSEVGASVEKLAVNPIARVGEHVRIYIAERRAAAERAGDEAATDDILTELALAKFPDGTTPLIEAVASLGQLLFGAGQDTTTHAVANGFRIIATRPDIQERLRAEPASIPAFVEEVLRYEGSAKAGGRLCTRSTTVGGVEVEAGTTILLAHLGANRDPRQFENPDRFDMDRPRLKEHLAFGRGPHTCIGAALARAEVRVSVERLLARLGNIRVSARHDGPDGEPVFEYEHSFILRAMSSLSLDFDPI